MKSLKFFKKIILLSTVLGIFACNDELKTVEGWKSIPVIYGFMSLNDTATYLRVEKAFVDPNGNAYDIAMIPDSLYYTDVTVTLVRVKNNERFTLTKVDGNTEGYVRQSGIFAKSPNYLYKIKSNVLSLKSDESWRVELYKKGETKPFAQSKSSNIVGDYEITVPSSTPVFLRYDNTFNVTLYTDEKAARVYDVKLVVNYDEIDPATPTQTTAKSVVWDFSTSVARKFNGTTPDPYVPFTRKGQDFYEFLGNSIPVVAGVKRTFKSINVEIYAGGQEFIDYTSANVANLGITGSQTLPNYSNIESGLGLFTSRNKTVKTGVKLSDAALDLLINGEFTKKLNFR